MEEIGNDIQKKTRRLKSSKGIRREREERRGRGGQGRSNEYRSKGISTRYKRVLFPRLL